MRIFKWLRWWWEERQAEEKAKENLLALAERRRALSWTEEETPSATDTYRTVTRAIDEVTAEKRQAKEKAQRILDK